MNGKLDFRPHLFVLGILKESNIGMGRQLLASCLTGEEDERIVKLRLNRLVNYSTLPLYQKKDIFDLVDLLQQKGYIELKEVQSKSYIKVFQLTKRGEEELKNPSSKIVPRKSFEGYY